MSPAVGLPTRPLLALCRHKLGDVLGARRDFDEAVRWQQQANLSPSQTAKMESFRAEAETLLPAQTRERKSVRRNQSVTKPIAG
jgi:hypothetical protein